jgi:RHS repeat-associated protein
MRVIEERDGSNNMETVYTRGTDLSGTLEGAGGIGGLLARSDQYSSGNPTRHNYYHADGNGNITYLVNSSQGLAASYRYDPFGRTISSSGTLAPFNLYRFSSKEIHSNSGMYYYLCRFYDPNLQRWINRTPVQENGGLNMYRFARNSPIHSFDALGRGKPTHTVRAFDHVAYYMGRLPFRPGDSGGGSGTWCLVGLSPDPFDPNDLWTVPLPIPPVLDIPGNTGPDPIAWLATTTVDPGLAASLASQLSNTQQSWLDSWISWFENSTFVVPVFFPISITDPFAPNPEVPIGIQTMNPIPPGEVPPFAGLRPGPGMTLIGTWGKPNPTH